MNQMKALIIVAVLTLAFLIPPAHAEDYEFTQCLSGTFTSFYQPK